MSVFRAALFAFCNLAAPAAFAACLTLAGYPEGRALATIALPPDNPTFALNYVHSVTRTPVSEHYRADGNDMVETEIRFEQHGPGLPTEADAGASFTRSDGKFVVTMDRHFPQIVMRVNADQSPRLVVSGHATNIAQWGNRALVLAMGSGACPGT